LTIFASILKTNHLAARHADVPVPRTPGARAAILLHCFQSERIFIAKTVIADTEHKLVVTIKVSLKHTHPVAEYAMHY